MKFRSSNDEMTEANIVKANIMVQIATNKALDVSAPKFNMEKFKKAIEYVLTLTTKHEDFYSGIYKAFFDAGVIFVILPNMSGSKINGATKKIKDNVVLMVNDRRLYADSFWFTLFHEIGHIINGDYGISFEKELGEEAADKYAEDSLIPPEKYQQFIKQKRFDVQSIKSFAKQINRDPGIVLGRLQNDKKVQFNDWTMKSLKHKYKITM